MCYLNHIRKDHSNGMSSITYHFLGLRLSVLLAIMALAVMLVVPSATRAALPAQSASADDYATEHLGAPWDMSNTDVLPLEYTRRAGNVANLSVANSILSATATNNDPRVTLLLPSDPNVNPVVPEGGYSPIDTSLYRYLTVRVNVSRQSYAQVFWQAGAGTPFNGSAFQQVNPGWQTITFDLKAGGNGSSGSWSGTVQGLYFDPMMTTGDFQIDYVRLSGAPLANPDNMPPVLQITAPSYISGPDYATTEMGNPWDMSDASDVSATHALGNVSFSNGVMSASTGNCSGTACGDPQIILHVGPRIDTSKYKYVTYRMKLDGTQDTNAGSVARYLWWSSVPEQSSVTRDIVVYEGWRTVSFDLTKIKLEPNSFATWANSNPSTFRFDPHEFTSPKSFQIDSIMLTGDNQADGSFDIRYNASDAENNQLRTTFYYDSDAQSFNGQPITCASAQISIPDGKYKLYLPALTQSGTPGSGVSGDSCRWDTSSVAAGTYYIYGVTTDGTNMTRVYSQTPVIVRH